MIIFRNCIYGSLLLVLTAALIPINAKAEELLQHGPAPFSDFDKDGSGFISEEEFDATRSQRMAAKTAEGRQMRGAASAPTFAEVDSDGDAPGFLGTDINTDGEISKEEFSTHQAEHHLSM